MPRSRAPWLATALVLAMLAPSMAGCLELLGLGGAPQALGTAPPPPGPTRYVDLGKDHVRIHRDGFGVPHIYADTEEGLMWGQGYAMAQDRLWQMEVFRRAAEGRLAELLGDGALPLDIQMRRALGPADDRWRVFDGLTAEDRGAFLAFADGVNAELVEALADPARKLPVEFAALGDPPQPWSVTDSVAIALLMFGVFGESGGQELQNALLWTPMERAHGAERAWDILADVVPGADAETPTTISPADRSYPIPDLPDRLPEAQRALLTPAVLDAARSVVEVSAQERDLLGELGFHGWGSNAIAVSGAHTASGKPVLLGGPQTGYAIPAVFWEGALHGGPFDVEGVIPPGIPGIAIGRTATFAWSVTSGDDDLADWFVEELVPGDPTHYKVGNRVEPLQQRVETFLVHDATNPASVPRVQEVTMWSTRHGPVSAFTRDGVYALARGSSLGADAVGRSACWARIAASPGWGAFERCVKQLAPSFNFVYADATGRIGYIHTARMPLRAPGFDPRFPLPGDGSADWQGFLAPEDLPEVVDPPSGWFLNWNNDPARGWPSGDQRDLWTKLDRAGSLQEVLAGLMEERGDRLTTDDLLEANHRIAERSLFARAFAPWLGEAPPGPARDALLAWIAKGAPILDANGDGKVDDPAVAAWEAFQLALTQRVLGPALGRFTSLPSFPAENDVNHDGHTTPGPSLLLRALAGGTHFNFLADPDSPDRASASEVVADALAAADAALEGKPKAMPQVVFREFGAAHAPPFPRQDRGSFNMVVDLATMASRSALAPGESGLVSAAIAAGVASNDHLLDQLDLYVGFSAKPVPFTVADVELAATSTLDLQVRRDVQVPLRLPAQVVDAMRAAGVPPIGLLGELST